MADGTTVLNPNVMPGGAGDIIATEVLGAGPEKAQRIKLMLGAIHTDGGDVTEANPLPVSAATLPLPSGASTAANQQTNALTDVQLRATPIPVIFPVDESGLTDAELRAVPVPVSGTFYQATQPVSGTVAVNNFPASQAVTGTFWQTTQPVSAAALPLPSGASQDGTDITSPTAMPAGGVGIRGWLSSIWTKLNGTLAVTGAFFQATQPVSLATAPTTPVTGTFWQATQPVSSAPDTYSVKSGTATASGTTIIHTPTGSNKIRLHYVGLGADAANASAVNVGIRFTAGGANFFHVPLVAGALWGRNIGAGRRYLQGGAGEALVINLSTAAIGIYVNIEYEEIP